MRIDSQLRKGIKGKKEGRRGEMSLPWQTTTNAFAILLCSILNDYYFFFNFRYGRSRESEGCGEAETDIRAGNQTGAQSDRRDRHSQQFGHYQASSNYC